MKKNNSLNILLHPFFLLTVIILVLNDHLLKEIYPTYLTGKLSDFAGLFVFSVFSTVILNKLFNASNFSLINYFLIALLFSFIKIIPIESWFPTDIIGFYPRIITDISDLIALSILPLSYFFYNKFKNNYTPVFNTKIKFLLVPLIFCCIVATSPALYKHTLKIESTPIYFLNENLSNQQFESFMLQKGYLINKKDSSEIRINYILRSYEYIVYDSAAFNKSEYDPYILHSEYNVSLFPSNHLTLNKIEISCYQDSINNQTAIQGVIKDFSNNIKPILK